MGEDPEWGRQRLGRDGVGNWTETGRERAGKKERGDGETERREGQSEMWKLQVEAGAAEEKRWSRAGGLGQAGA